MFKYSTLLFLLVVSLATPNVRAQATTSILVLGDSLSAGYGLNPQEVWVELLREKACRRGRRCSVANASVSGETTGGGRARLAQLLDRHHPDILILELGGNDGLRGHPLLTIRDNLASMILTAQTSRVRVVLIGMHIPPNYGRRYTDGFHAIYQGLATEYNTALVPFLLEGVATRTELMQEDGIHPRAEAQPQLLENVMRALAPLLPAVDPGHVAGLR